MRIPENPPVRIGIFGTSDLVSDLYGTKDLAAKGVVAECLKPGTKFLGVGVSALDAVFNAEPDDVVDVVVRSHRVSVSGDAELET